MLSRKSVNCLISVLLVLTLSIRATGAQEHTNMQMAISGHVFDQNKKPVCGISISASAKNSIPLRTVFTDQQGYYKLQLQRPGIYKIAVRSICQELAHRDNVGTSSNGIDFLVALCELRGRAAFPNKAVLDRDVSIEATSVDWAITKNLMVRAKENPAGSFVFKQLPPAPFQLTAKAYGYADAIKTINLQENQTPHLVLELLPLCRFKIRVIEATSKIPLNGVVVNIVETIEGTPKWRYAGETDQNGLCTDDQTRPGKVTIVATNPSQKRAELSTEAVPGKEQQVCLELDRSACVIVKLKRRDGLPVSEPLKVDAVPILPPLARIVYEVNGVYSGYRTGADTYAIRLPQGKYKVRAYTSTIPKTNRLVLQGASTAVTEGPTIDIGKNQIKTVEIIIGR